MTREEVMKGLEAIADCTGLSVAAKQVIGRLSVHDAEQRQTIEQQAQEIVRLREALKDAMNLIDVDNLTTQTVYRNCQQALKESAP